MKNTIKNIKLFTVIFGLIFPTFGVGSENNHISDARSSALGDASVSLSSPENPSSNSLHRESSLAIHYANPFGVKELSTVSAQLFYANRMLDLGVSLSRFGYEKYNETTISGYFSRKLSSRLALGVRINYLSLMMSEYEDRKSVLSGDIGFLAEVLPKLTIGMSVDHLLRTKYSTARGDFEMPLILHLGANYRQGKDLMLVAEIEKDNLNDPLLKIGCEYLSLEEVALRIGLLTNPYRPTFGIGYSTGHFVFDVASIYHLILGFNTQFSMKYKF
ncbi:MAG: hypothetical protein PHV20_04210 [Bacteroidales bacterium]|nr:hypothetical protein [Bacteroidales bacterium]